MGHCRPGCVDFRYNRASFSPISDISFIVVLSGGGPGFPRSLRQRFPVICIIIRRGMRCAEYICLFGAILDTDSISDANSRPYGSIILTPPEVIMRIPPLPTALSRGLHSPPPIAWGSIGDFALEEGIARPAIFYTPEKILYGKRY